jgi:hypothetical protein
MADKYLAQVNGQITEKAAVASSTGAADAGKIPALDATGKLAANMMPTGIGAEIQVLTVDTDTLVAGDFVNITANGVRKADASANRPAHGFVLAGYAPGASADVYSISQTNTAVAQTTLGAKYFLGTNGAITTTAPSTSGYCSQCVGIGTGTTSIVFAPSYPIVLA